MKSKDQVLLENLVKENIQFVSRNINYAKNTMSHEDTLNFIKIIIENYKTNL
jgi:hypothetical protein